MIFYLSDALFLPQKDAQGSILTGLVNGYGQLVNGIQVPYWDTLFGLLNLEDAPVTARFRFWDERTGNVVVWPDGQDHADVVLKPGLAFAATLIPGNGFAHPPAEFQGHGTIECMEASVPYGNVYAWSMVSGRNWDSKAPSYEVPVLQDLQERTRWVFPYVIPQWEDPNHAGDDAYDTGLSIQNFSDSYATVKLAYTVNQCYADAGKLFKTSVLIGPNCGIRKLLRELFIDLPTMSEGHLIIESDLPAKLFPSTIIATKNFIFGAGQSFC